MFSYDIQKSRSIKNYSKKIIVKRVIWGALSLLFYYSPRTAFSYRNFLLSLMGAEIANDVRIYNKASIFMPWNLKIGKYSTIGDDAYIYNIAEIIIGDNVTISQRAHLCAGTHDYESQSFELIFKPIKISDNTWVCTDAFVGPGVEIGNCVVIGARSVVVSNVKDNSIVAGNPAIVIKERMII